MAADMPVKDRHSPSPLQLSEWMSRGAHVGGASCPTGITPTHGIIFGYRKEKSQTENSASHRWRPGRCDYQLRRIGVRDWSCDFSLADVRGRESRTILSSGQTISPYQDLTGWRLRTVAWFCGGRHSVLLPGRRCGTGQVLTLPANPSRGFTDWTAVENRTAGQRVLASKDDPDNWSVKFEFDHYDWVP